MIATFTIAALDPETKTLGIASASNYLAIGSLVPHISVTAGLVASQSMANPRASRQALDCLTDGHSVEQALDVYLSHDTYADFRQVAIMNLDGDAVIHSGSRCVPVVESTQGKHFICLGNMLVEGTVAAMALRYEASRTAGRPMAEALLDALLAAQDAGGDKRGKLSACLRVSRKDAGYMATSDSLIDLRVDASPAPIAELRHCYAVNQLYNSACMSPGWLELLALQDKERLLLERFATLYGDSGVSVMEPGYLSGIFMQQNIPHLFDTSSARINQAFFAHIESMPLLRNPPNSQ